MQCRNHAEAAAADRCVGCMEPFCGYCLVTVRGQKYCSSCKVLVLGAGMPIIEEATTPCTEAAEALKYALVSLFCFGMIVGPIAIVKAVNARKLIAADPRLTGEGKANVAIVIASVGLFLWAIGMLMKARHV